MERWIFYGVMLVIVGLILLVEYLGRHLDDEVDDLKIDDKPKGREARVRN